MAAGLRGNGSYFLRCEDDGALHYLMDELPPHLRLAARLRWLPNISMAMEYIARHSRDERKRVSALLREAQQLMRETAEAEGLLGEILS